MEELSLEKLIRKRSTIKASLTRHRNFVTKLDLANVTPIQIDEIQIRIPKVEVLLEEFNFVQSNIEDLEDKEETLQGEERETFEETYYSILGTLNHLIPKSAKHISTDLKSVSQVDSIKDIVHQFQNSDMQQDNANDNINCNNANNITSYGSNHIQHVKLPQLVLPTFDGQVDQWLNFHDMFTSLIHKNDDLSPIQKFQYLKTSLSGDAAAVIQSLEISSTNYDIAFKLLKERFENKSRIIDSHFKSLFEFEALHKESHFQLQALLNNTLKHIRSLKSLGQPTDQWDSILIYLIRSKLDPTTRREWEKFKSDLPELPIMDDLCSFLTKKCQLLESIQGNTKGSSISTNKSSRTTSVHIATQKPNCKICKGNHAVYHCQKFIQMSIPNRINEIVKHKLCKNCFRSNHVTRECKSSNCRTCNQRHNTLLHLTTDHSSIPSSPMINQGPTETQAHTAVNCSFKPKHVLLPTAIVLVCDNQGTFHEVRILLDCASQSNFIRQDMIDKLSLRTTTVNVPIAGINKSTSYVNEMTTVTLHSRINQFKCCISCLVLPEITDTLPQSTLNSIEFFVPEDIQLADPTFAEPSPISILVGAEVFWTLICIGQIYLGKNLPMLQKTHFGYIVSGAVSRKYQSKSNSSCLLAIQEYKTLDIQKQMAAFWQIEEYQMPHPKTQEELECEQLFTQTTSREEDGRFIVNLPFKNNIQLLGHSHDIAQRRYSLLEKRLNSNPNLKTQYVNFMQEYIDLGHMTAVEYPDNRAACFLPHHPVLKPDNLTTKVRVVFDASCQTSTGISLNDTLKVGPVVQSDLFTILLRFRLHEVAFTSDCEKMYRQIWIDKNDRKYQNILWNNQTYQLNTVTYGTSSAPYLATRCILQIAQENSQLFPVVCKTIKESCYVDDLICSCRSVEDATRLVNDINTLFKKYGLQMRKWSSNHSQILENIESTNRIIHFNDETRAVKTLGLDWDSRHDLFRFPFKPKDTSSHVTKRTILSSISSLFDPLGLVSPTLVKAKIIMQRLWQLKLTWDESLPMDLHTMWSIYYEDLPHISAITIPRHTLGKGTINIQLHAFSDASELSYGACVYLRSTDSSGHHIVNLLCAKGRVAPLKVLTIPKLELMAAHLLARLVSQVHNAISANIQISEIHCWCDSSIVLAWLRKMPNQLKIFVAHRVADISSLTDTSNWHYVPSTENPADVLSRGMSASQLSSSDLWWHGPHWLSQEPEVWPKLTFNLSSQEIPEVKSSVFAAPSTSTEQSFISSLVNNYSSLIRLQRIIAYCLRFFRNSSDNHTKVKGVLSVAEMTCSLKVVIKQVQKEVFAEEFRQMKSHGFVSVQSRLKKLNPFIDEDELIRVGGRLGHSVLSVDKKHPMILPNKHTLVTLIIQHYHLLLFHAGSEATFSAITQKFWIIRGKMLVKSFIYKCVICRRFNSKPINPLMGDLPESRVSPSRAFSVCGTDFAGPFSIGEGRGRVRKVNKSYLCVFVCFSTKAVHLEIVSSLSTEAFIACLKRFLARRGFCREIHSDNSATFVGANNEIKAWYKLHSDLNHNYEIANFLSKYSIQWKFIPARSPHMGGLWESVVKSAKRHLHKITKNTISTFEELNTLFCQVEAILNSRPLIPLSSNPNNLQFLSPGHFLVGDSLMALPEPSLLEISQNRLSRFQGIQQMQQRFWKLWTNDYLTSLQVRSKWHRKGDAPVQPGALVLLREPNTPPLLWKMGRIIETYPGTDGIVRVVSIKTSTGTVKRAVHKIVELLPE